MCAIQDSVALHGGVSISVLSRPFSLRLLFVERAKSAARSASCSFQSLRIAGTFGPRVSQHVEQAAAACSRKICRAWVRRVKACVAAKGGFFFFWNIDPENSQRAAQRYSAKHVIDTELTRASWPSCFLYAGCQFPGWHSFSQRDGA